MSCSTIICNFCEKKAWSDPAGYGFQVSECRKCDVLVCEDCAEVDYDGSSEGYRCTQWNCPNCVKARAVARASERAAAAIRALDHPTHADYKRII